MTPAIIFLKEHNISYKIHEYDHDSHSDSYGFEVAEKLHVSKRQVFKTLVLITDKNELAVAVVPVYFMLNMKLMAKVLGVKKVVMANKTLVERTTAYVLGGVSPLGQKKRLKTIVDSSINSLDTVFVSAGRRGLEIELSPADLIALTGALVANIAQ